MYICTCVHAHIRFYRSDRSFTDIYMPSNFKCNCFAAMKSFTLQITLWLTSLWIEFAPASLIIQSSTLQSRVIIRIIFWIFWCVNNNHNTNNLMSYVTVTGFATENELVDKYLLSTSPTIGNINRSHETVKSDGPDLFGENAESSPILAGIVFTNDFPDDGSNFPTDIQVQMDFNDSCLKWHADIHRNIFGTVQTTVSGNSSSKF